MGGSAVKLLFVTCVHLSTVTFTFESGVENWTFLQEDFSSRFSQDEDLKCFTRMLDDLTCFWEDSEESNYTYNFFYSTEQSLQKQCQTTTYRVLGNTMRHVCAVPVEDIVLFEPLLIEVIESFSNVSKISQYVSIESVVLLGPPSNVSVHLNGNPRELRVGWVPPKNPDINEFLMYEISYWKETSIPTSAKSMTVSVKQHYDLQDLKAGIRYMVRLRTKPDGISFDGFWSPWSETMSAVTPYSSDEINLRCSSPDFQFITCQWKVNKTEAGTRFHLYYHSRKAEWKMCNNQRNTTTANGIVYYCTIAASEANKTIVIINASYPHHTQTFYKKPFRTENIVRPDPPRIVKTDISTTGGKLRLFWEPPIRKLQNQMVYQIRYSEENGTGWKTLHIQKPLHSEVLDLPHGKIYYMQLRTKPNGLLYKGYWSNWSDTFTAIIPGSIGLTAVSFVVGMALLLAIALFVSHLIFPNVYSDMKKKLWPKIPNLEKLMEGYLTDFQKYSQDITKRIDEDRAIDVVLMLQSEQLTQISCMEGKTWLKSSLQSTCDKPMDDEPLPSVLEIISEGNGNGGKNGVEKQEDTCQKHHSSESSTTKLQGGGSDGKTEGSNDNNQNYIFLDLQDSSSLPQDDSDFHKKEKTNSPHDSQSQRWPPAPNAKGHKGHVQNGISWNKQLSSLQSVNVTSIKQHYPASVVTYDDVLQLFAHLHFPVPFDYRSMSATDISNHSYLLLSDLEPNTLSQQCTLIKE